MDTQKGAETLTVPGWYALLLIGLGVYRICRLVGWDDITAPLRSRLVLADAQHSQWTYAMNALQDIGQDPFDYQYNGRDAEAFVAHIEASTGSDTIPPLVYDRLHAGLRNTTIVPFTRTRWYVSKLIRCAWCLGWWLGVLVWIAYQAAPRGTLIAMSLFAVSAIPGLVAKNLD